jgi:hypothetical protein
MRDCDFRIAKISVLGHYRATQEKIVILAQHEQSMMKLLRTLFCCWRDVEHKQSGRVQSIIESYFKTDLKHSINSKWFNSLTL